MKNPRVLVYWLVKLLLLNESFLDLQQPPYEGEICLKYGKLIIDYCSSLIAFNSTAESATGSSMALTTLAYCWVECKVALYVAIKIVMEEEVEWRHSTCLRTYIFSFQFSVRVRVRVYRTYFTHCTLSPQTACSSFHFFSLFNFSTEKHNTTHSRRKILSHHTQLNSNESNSINNWIPISVSSVIYYSVVTHAT